MPDCEKRSVDRSSLQLCSSYDNACLLFPYRYHCRKQIYSMQINVRRCSHAFFQKTRQNILNHFTCHFTCILIQECVDVYILENKTKILGFFLFIFFALIFAFFACIHNYKPHNDEIIAKSSECIVLHLSLCLKLT